MKKPDLKDFRLKSIKLQKNGGAELEFRYLYAVGNDGHNVNIKFTNSLNVHDDLFELIQDQKPKILQVDEINYRIMVETAQKMDANNLEKLSQIAEGMTAQQLSKLYVTGIKLSGTESKPNAVITYHKVTGNGKIAGRATTLINLSGNVYGFEDDFQHDIEQMIKETYAYLYENKHSNSEQYTLPWADTAEELSKEVEKKKKGNKKAA